MSLIAVVVVGKDTHIVSEKEMLRHVLIDTVFCPCSPTCQMIEDEPDLPLVIQHFPLASRKWSRVSGT